jgi:UDP-glucose 4-epimerase
MQSVFPMAVLVTGGAGYIGSHMVSLLCAAGRDVVVVDDLSTGAADAVPDDVPLIVADIASRDAMAWALRAHKIDAIIHFAARSQIGEAVVDPQRYWKGNVVATALLLESALEHGVGTFILSSTAAVYGAPDAVPIAESATLAPVNPYGDTKLAIETMLRAYGRAYGLRWAALRYFNAAGADAARGLRERHEPETHLVPLILDVAAARRPFVTLHGCDYSTPDGTCVRDYVHVSDLADAHLAALDYLAREGESCAMNLGTGTGHSVAEMIETCRSVTSRHIPVVAGPRRPGDPPSLVASPDLAHERLAWRATRSTPERIVADAWSVHETNSRAPSGRKVHHVHVW